MGNFVKKLTELIRRVGQFCTGGLGWLRF